MQEDKTNKTPTTKGMGKEIGASGTVIFKGIISQEEYNAKLSNLHSAIRIYETMRRSDATVRSTLLVIKLPLLSIEWSVRPASDEDADKEIADFVERELFERNVKWTNFLREALTMFDFGFSVAEKVYELTEYEGKTRIGIKKLGFRKQNSIYSWETLDGRPGVQQQLTTDANIVSIPAEKLVIFTNDKEGDNYEGISVLRFAYKHWDIKDKLDLVNAIAIEKLALGVPVLKKPDGADPAELTKARAAMTNFRTNESGYQEIPVGWELEMMDMKSNSTKDAIPTIKYHDRQIQLSVLSQFLSLGASDSSGARAVSEDHSKLFMLSEEAAAKNLQATIQESLIKQLCDLNFTADILKNGYPKITFSRVGDEKTTELAENVKMLMDAGAVHYDVSLEEYLRKILRLPQLPEHIKKRIEEALEAEIESPEKQTNTKPVDSEDKSIKDEKSVEASAIDGAKKARKKLLDVLIG